MSDMFEAKITRRLNDVSFTEIVRDTIAGIIDVEMKNQYKLALEDGDIAAKDYDVEVVVERGLPVQAGEDGDKFPLINVSVSELNDPEGDNTGNAYRRKFLGRYNIDCYQKGTMGMREDGKNAAIMAWKLARCVFKILYYDSYAVLGLRGIVGYKKIKKMSCGWGDTSEAASNIYVVSIELETTFEETSFYSEGVDFEGVTIAVLDEKGRIVG